MTDPTNNHVLIDHLAMIAHEANRCLQRAIGENVNPPWTEAPAWQQASARDGVKNVLAHPFQEPAESHANWLAYKEADGWTYGPVKDEQKKEHPCMVPYDQLPDAQRLKDKVFTESVRTVFLSVASIETSK